MCVIRVETYDTALEWHPANLKYRKKTHTYKKTKRIQNLNHESKTQKIREQNAHNENKHPEKIGKVGY